MSEAIASLSYFVASSITPLNFIGAAHFYFGIYSISTSPTKNTLPQTNIKSFADAFCFALATASFTSANICPCNWYDAACFCKSAAGSALGICALVK